MENYQEQYKQELHQQEINSNLRTLKGFFWIFVTILILWLLTLVRIFIVDAEIFTMAAGLSVVMAVVSIYFWAWHATVRRRLSDKAGSILHR